MTNDVMLEDTLRDVAAARAELSGRRDQLIAEYEERLSALEQVAVGVGSGELDLRSAQGRIRTLLGDRGATASPRRAGRTTIGMPVPMGRTPSASTGGLSGSSSAGTVPRSAGPTTSRTSGAVRTVLADIDSRIVGLLAQGYSQPEEREARFELALLVKMRRALECHLEALPRDVVLLGSVVEYVELAEQTIADLASAGPARIVRLLDFDRTLVAECVALGGSAPGVKEEISKARALLEGDEPDLDGAFTGAATVFYKLKEEIHRRFPDRRDSLLDQMLA